jgi:hypothetical protein
MDMYSSRDVDPSPERQLWCAVVGRALDDALGHPGGISGAFAQSRAITEARDWFRENGTDFRQASEAAGYDPDILRARVLRMLGCDDDAGERKNEMTPPGKTASASGLPANVPVPLAARAQLYK